MQCGLDQGLPPCQVPSLSIQPFRHIGHGPKIGEGALPFSGRGAGSPFNTKSPEPRPTSIPSGILIHTAILTTTDMGRKLGAVPLWRRRRWVPSNKMWPRSRPTCMPSLILIHPTVWPHYTRQTGQTGRQTGQRSDSIGRTVLQTVVQKRLNRSTCRLGCGLGLAEGSTNSVVFARWHHLANAIEPSVCGGYAVLCQVTLTTC